MYLLVMLPSLLFGEPSRAELFGQRAEPSRAFVLQKPSQNEPKIFLGTRKHDGFFFIYIFDYSQLIFY